MAAKPRPRMEWVYPRAPVARTAPRERTIKAVRKKSKPLADRQPGFPGGRRSAGEPLSSTTGTVRLFSRRMIIMKTKFALFATLACITSAIAAGQQVSVNYNHSQSLTQFHTYACGAN